MKLLTRYNRANFITATIILVASSISYYIIIRQVLLKQLDKDLKVEEQEIHEYVKANKSLPNASHYKGQQIKFELAGNVNIKRRTQTSTVYNAQEDEDEPVRVLSFPVEVNGVLHKAIVIKSQVEAEDLLKIIVLVTAAIIALLLLIISVINRLLLSKLWQPFHIMLEQLRTFDLNSKKKLELPTTQVEEFQELNASVSVMTSRMTEDFQTLKTFTDNASHEMQTPLAIINSKLDILLQSATQKQAEQLQGIYNATGRLTILNQTLLLLTKINNEQFRKQETINFKNLIEKKLQQFDELLKAKNLTIITELEDVAINVNYELAEIMMNNFLSNSIKHNYDNGHIEVKLNKKEFQIANSGPDLTFDKKDIFKRFQKSSHSSGTGLGLAVIKQICEDSKFKIFYTPLSEQHSFTVTF